MAKKKRSKESQKRAVYSRMEHLARRTATNSSSVKAIHIDDTKREFGGIVKVSVNLATDTNNGRKVLVLERTDKNIKGSAAIFVAGGRSVDSKVAKANKIVLSNNKSSKGMK